MSKVTIHIGRNKPLTAVGKNQVKMLQFAFEYPTWHSFRADDATLRAVNGLLKRGSIQVNDRFDMFKINMK